MHKSQESAGLPVPASSSVATEHQPATPADPSASDWIAELLSEISGHIVVVRELLDKAISNDGDANVEHAVNVIMGLIGYLTDEGLRRAGQPLYTQHTDALRWLVSESTLEEISSTDAAAGSNA